MPRRFDSGDVAQGGFLSHGGTPSYHPNFNGIFPNKDHPFGDTPIIGNPHICFIYFLPLKPPCINWGFPLAAGFFLFFCCYKELADDGCLLIVVSMVFFCIYTYIYTHVNYFSL